MKKPFISALTAASIFLMPIAKADSPGSTDTQTEMDSSQPPSQLPESQPGQTPAAPTNPTAPAAPAEPSSGGESITGTVPSSTLDADSSPDDETYVGSPSNEGSKAAKKKMWRSIGLAVASVAIAVTALILVSKNDGHRK